MACSDSVDVRLLHKVEILIIPLPRHSPAVIGIKIVTVYALDNDLLTVYIIYVSDYFNTLEADPYLLFHSTAIALVKADRQRVKLRSFGAPSAAILNSMSDFQLAARLVLEYLLFVKADLAGDGLVRAEFQRQVKYSVGVAVVKSCSCVDILNGGLRLCNKAYLTVNSRKLPHILIFKIGCIAETHNPCHKQVFTLVKLVCDIKLRRRHRALRIADISAVDIDIKSRLCRTEVQDHSPAVKAFGQGKFATVKADLVFLMADFRNLRLHG